MLEGFVGEGHEKLEAALLEISMYDTIEELLSEYESLNRYREALSRLLSSEILSELKAIRIEISSLIERISREEILHSRTMDPSVVSPIIRNRYQPAITEIMKRIREAKVRVSNDLEAFINTVLEIIRHSKQADALLPFLSSQLRGMLERIELVPPELPISTLELLVRHVPHEGSPEIVFKEIRDLRTALAELSPDLSEENRERVMHALNTLDYVEIVVRRFPGLSGASLKYLEELKGRLLDDLMRSLS